MTWLEAFQISILVVGLGGGFLFFIIHSFMLGLCDENPKVMRVVDTIMIGVLVVCLFAFPSWIQKDDTDSSGGYSYSGDYGYGSDWDNYDYDNDGNINQGEWEDALGDYMDKYMP